MTAQMSRTTGIVLVVSGVLLLVMLIGLGVWRSKGSEQTAQDVPDDELSIGGVVLTNGRTPEGGVWVIAETDSLPTHFRRIVVTHDQGRFLVPDLPEGTYDVWVRGYGLRDSEPVTAARGGQLTLQVAPRSPQEAAKIYPANYWLSLYQVPPTEALPVEDAEDREAVPGRRDQGNEGSQAALSFPSQAHWVGHMKLGCMLYHQLGGELTRLWTRPEDWDVLWERAPSMTRTANGLGKDVFKRSLADWASRIAAGEIPAPPPRPAGLERNIVITQWTWGRDDSYLHDNVATDKRKPTLYPDGKVWGLDIGQDTLWALDPVNHSVTSYPVPTRNGWHDKQRLANATWKAYNMVANPHNPMMDDQGRVWITTQIRGAEDRPQWARDVVGEALGTDQVSEAAKAKLAPKIGGSRQLEYFDPQAQKFVLIDTLYATHHLQFDGEGRLWTSGDSEALGMFDPSKFDPARPEQTEARAQTAWVKIDPKTGKSVMGNGYGIMVNPVDGTVWRASYPGIFGAPPLPNSVGNRIDKFDPKTRTYKQYPLPLPGYGPRGVDATTDGKVWFATGSGHLGRFDPRSETFTYWETPGPKIRGTATETGSADFHYYLWVDQHNTFGLGKDMVIVNGTNSDSLLVFDPVKEQFTVIRVPYPLGMFSRGLDRRIDDPNVGWKGRGLWVSNNIDPLIMTEKKMGFLNHIQLRPNPLAR